MITGREIGHPTEIPAGQWPTPIHRETQERQGGAGTHYHDKPLSLSHPAPGPSIPVDSDTPAWKRLIGYSLFTHEVNSLIEAIFTSKDEVKLIGDLRGDDAQTFINVIHEVCFAFPLQGVHPDSFVPLGSCT